MRNITTSAATRRQFLIGSAGITFALALPRTGFAANAKDAAGVAANAWIRILPDDTMVIMAPASELGQGSMTSLPLVIAEELDADWDKVRIEMSPPDTKLYGNPFVTGPSKYGKAGQMLTINSYSVRGYYTAIRLAGAKARLSLMAAAAGIWNLPAGELETEPNLVVHRASGRRMSYGAIAASGVALPAPPDLKPADLKPPARFRLIGKDVPRRDLPAKVDGTAEYALNIQLPNMVYATVVRSPVLGAAPIRVEDKAAREVPGILAITLMPDAVAIVGSTMEAVFKARELAPISWSTVPAAEAFDGDKAVAARVAIARDTATGGKIWLQQGNVATAFAAAAKVIEREYRTDFMYHAQIEPLNAVAAIAKDGRRIEIWAGTQAPAYAVQAVAAALGLEEEAVTLHRSYPGGAFGRRAAHDQDYVVDAAVLSQQLGRPVKVIWSRQDDVRAGRFKPMTGQWLKMAVDKDGHPTAWHHRLVSEDPSEMQDPPRWHMRKEAPYTAMSSSRVGADGIFRGKVLYDIDNQLIEFIRQPLIVRVAAMRGVGATPGRFALEQFLDEVAVETGVDPIALRIRLMKSTPRGQRVLERVAALSDWGKNLPGRAKGVAFSDYDDTMQAVVVEISVDRSTGVIRVHRGWASIDAGIVVQPANSVAQIEGGMIFGICNVLKERITIAKGRVQQSSFDDYPILRHDEVPDEIVVDIVPSEAAPAGIGEAAAVPPAAAVANAFAALTGKRVRHLPLIPERVMAALAS